MQKVRIESVKTGAAKMVAPVFADILVGLGKYRRADEQPESVPDTPKPRPRRTPRTNSPKKEPGGRTYRRRDLTAEE